MIENILFFIVMYTVYILIYYLVVYFFCRIYKVRVDKFYVWFDAGFRLFKIKRGYTEFGLGWLPLGGYLKISGMLLEEGEELQPYHFRAASPLRQIFMIASGPVICLLTGVFIYMLQLDQIPTVYYTYTIGLIAFVLFELIVYGQVSSRLAVRPKPGETPKFRFSAYLVALFFLITVLFVSILYVHELTPFFGQVEAIISGNQPLSFVAMTKSSWYTVTSFLGVWFFIMNMLPIGGLNGSLVIATLYEAAAGHPIPEKMAMKYQLISMLILFGLYGYVFYIWLF